MIADALQRYAEELYEEIGGGLCICQRADVSHWCETCQRRIGRIREVLATVREEPQELVIAGTCGRYNAPHHCANCGNSFTALTAEGRAPEPPKDVSGHLDGEDAANFCPRCEMDLLDCVCLDAEARVPHEPPANGFEIAFSVFNVWRQKLPATGFTSHGQGVLFREMLRDAFRNAAQEARPAPPLDWQPIATAPKDADMLLLYSERDGLRSGFWYESLSPEAPDGWCCVETQGLTGGRMEPTHWAIPDPPAAVPQP